MAPRTGTDRRRKRGTSWVTAVLVVLAALVVRGQAEAVSLSVRSVPPGGGTPAEVADYRWTLEEDNTYHVNPGVPDANTLSVGFHRSYMPVVAQGIGNTLPPACGPDVTGLCLDPTKHYYVSVMPTVPGSYSIGGAQIAPQQAAVAVYVHQQPIPTAQITILVFEDNFPINGAPDTPQESGLEGFRILLEDGGGRYGMSAGMQMMDAFGNPLGTTYNQTCGASGTEFCFNPDGTPVVAQLGTGIITTDANGEATIKHLAPGKYGIQAVPPPGSNWQQTSTIEGTKVIDAWVKADEPAFFQEFGPPGWHVFVGFVEPFADATVLTGGSTVTGQVVNLHLSRPPDYAFYNGGPFVHTTPWVGLNQGAAGAGRGVYAARCNPDGTFAIPNVPPGTYQLAVWDDNLDLIFAFHQVTVEASDLNLGDVPVFQWFTRLEHHVFNDLNRNGLRDSGEPGIPEVPVNLRWRDGTMYQSAPTDGAGFVPFDQVFPFFAWQVAEVDFARLKATGVTVTVDDGGPIDPANPLSWGGQLSPQPQSCTQSDIDAGVPECPAGSAGLPRINPNRGDNLAATYAGPALVMGFQGFIGQTSVLEWGKAAYHPADEDNPPLGDFPGPGDKDWNGNALLDPAENGGISGVVYYSATRAEDEAQDGAPEVWEPGIPRVQVNLYRDCNADGVIDVPDLTPGSSACLALGSAATAPNLADVDNHPLGWSDGTALKGAEDLDRNGNGVFDLGDAVEITHTDSWDDSLPAGCQGEVFQFLGLYPKDCYDGLRNFNQVRPAVFDGGYAFGEAAGGYLPAGTYIVEAVAPPGYEIVKNQDKNVDFGEDRVPSLLALPPSCVNWDDVDVDGAPGYTVPPELSLFPGVPAATAGQPRALCDRKKVALAEGQNAAADFFLFTHAPIAGHIYGFILDDTQNEFDPAAPNFGEKYAPPWMPISIRDWTGREIARTYSDQYGVYNALVPSTYSANLPQPSGMSPGMITVCLNTPVMPDPANPDSYIPDPNFNRQYSQFCYTFQYMPGTTTYLDTPVIPVAAFAGPGQFPLDCEFGEGTPMIHSVSNAAGTPVGPWVPAAGQQIAITSQGPTQVPNPSFNNLDPLCAGVDPTLPGAPVACRITIARDFGFGAATGTVTVGGIRAAVGSWTDTTIVATVPAGVTAGQVMVSRGDNGKTTPVGVTLTVGGAAPVVVSQAGGNYSKIQEAVDAAPAGSLVTVAPGTYDELVVLWKPLRLQGWGTGSTVINAVKVPAEKLAFWREKVRNLVATGAVTLLPGQETGAAGGVEPALLFNEEGPGILVLPKEGQFGTGGVSNARIDGLTITGADHAGGIVVNGYAHRLEIANNRIVGNNGVFGGGIRVGHADLTVETPELDYQSGFNDNLNIHHNQVIENSGLNGVGGGVSLYTGCDGYQVTSNFLCGNFSAGGGGGIGHEGLSPNGVIAYNTVVFNESFNQGITVNGGGILVGGAAPLALTGAASLSPGSGNVKILSNLVLGNAAAAGDGGGIRTQRVNGQDVAGRAARNRPDRWYNVDILNNVIANNSAALAGGGISLQDTAMSNILHNTIANNDSTATAGEAFAPGSPNQSTPQPAGIVSRAHTPALASAFGNAQAVRRYSVFSNPQFLEDNIIWHNRSFYFFGDPNADPPVPYQLLPDPDTPAYSDLAVLGTGLSPAPLLRPEHCILTSTAGYSPSNVSVDPNFVHEYVNVDRGSTVLQPEITTAIQVQPAFDEGGNFIRTRYGPLTLLRIDPLTGLPVDPPEPYGDYHVLTRRDGMPVATFNTRATAFPDLRLDLDRQVRPAPVSTRPDIGADELP
ncbi:MAG: hypothetical protein HY900_20475 [Deltaproteobacteria bacterium]|nr:hypothetical protein [Deltaproteobacteria bacterium]